MRHKSVIYRVQQLGLTVFGHIFFDGDEEFKLDCGLLRFVSQTGDRLIAERQSKEKPGETGGDIGAGANELVDIGADVVDGVIGGGGRHCLRQEGRGVAEFLLAKDGYSVERPVDLLGGMVAPGGHAGLSGLDHASVIRRFDLLGCEN